MSGVSYKTTWIGEYERQREYYLDAIDPFENWESLGGHASIAELFLKQGLEALYGEAPANVVKKFFIAALQIVARAEAEDRFQTGRFTAGEFPLNRARALRTRAYARALLTGNSTREDLVQASNDFERWCSRCTRRNWDGQAQAHFLAAVRVAIIAGDLERVDSLLRHELGFRWHSEEHEIYLAMTKEFKRSTKIRGQRLTSRFRELFDCYRDPGFQSEVFLETGMVRFEMGVIWCRFFAAGEFVWPSAVEAVSK